MEMFACDYTQHVTLPTTAFACRSTAIHRVGAQLFSDHLVWNVEVKEGREADEYDSFSPTYILDVNDEDAIAVYARLLLPRSFRRCWKGHLRSFARPTGSPLIRP
jgi:hypothetical protein